MLRSVFAVALAALFPVTAFALDCPKPEKQHRSEISGESSCLADVVKGAPVCGPGRKSRVINRVKQQFLCEPDPTANAKCPSPEQAIKDRFGNEYCKPAGGQCAPGRKNQPHHRLADVVVCVPGKPGEGNGDASPTCPSNERAYHPTNKSIKPFCEAVSGRCGSLRTMVKSAVPGHEMCIDK